MAGPRIVPALRVMLACVPSQALARPAFDAGAVPAPRLAMHGPGWPVASHLPFLAGSAWVLRRAGR